MLSISLDEGIVFDVLAITIVKQRIKPSENNNGIINQMKREISSQIGQEKVDIILESEEFKELIKINADVFDLVDRAQNGNGLARDVQDGNYKRYKQKTLLQKKFFDTPIKEEKM